MLRMFYIQAEVLRALLAGLPKIEFSELPPSALHA